MVSPNFSAIFFKTDIQIILIPGVTCEMGLMVEWHCFGWPVPGSQIVGRSREEARDHENYRIRFYDL